jgi:hypothetical protein
MASDELLDVLVYLPGTAPRKLAGNALMTVDEMRRQVANDTDLIVITADDDADDSDADLEASPISGDCELPKAHDSSQILALNTRQEGPSVVEAQAASYRH